MQKKVSGKNGRSIIQGFAKMSSEHPLARVGTLRRMSELTRGSWFLFLAGRLESR